MRGESSPNLDKVQKSYLKQLWAIQQIKDHDQKIIQKKYAQLAFVYLNLGITSDALKKQEEAAMYFHKSLSICNKYKLGNNTSLLVHASMAQLLLDKKEYDSCKVYAQRAIILEKISPFPEVRRDLFQMLYKLDLAKGNEQSAEKYTNLYMKLNDSINNAQKRRINTPVKLIVEKKEKEKNNKVKNVIIISAIISFILLLSGWLFWRRKNKKLQEDYQKLIEKSKVNDQNIEISMKNPSDNNVNIILEKLNNFEKSGKFTSKAISLNSLAEQLDTNPESLSEIIKEYKQKSFGNYINDLRIHKIVYLIYSDPESRIYREDYIAKNNGFTSKAEFITAFKRATGIPFSYFIKKLEKEPNK